MIVINNIVYRKANLTDVSSIALLVTNLLGTCNIDKNNRKIKSFDEINNENKKEIEKDINNYYVCEINNNVIAAVGISDIREDNIYNINIKKYREILYLVVDNNYQKKGIGTQLLKQCIENINDIILYEAWGEKENVNSKYLLENLKFKKLIDLGDTYYKENGYCSYCINRDKNCNSCKAELWIKNYN